MPMDSPRICHSARLLKGSAKGNAMKCMEMQTHTASAQSSQMIMSDEGYALNKQNEASNLSSR